MRGCRLAMGSTTSRRRRMSFPVVTKAATVLSALIAFALMSALAGDRALALYPERIVKIVVPFAPGGGTDLVALTLAREIPTHLARSVIVHSKRRAGTFIYTHLLAAL